MRVAKRENRSGKWSDIQPLILIYMYVSVTYKTPRAETIMANCDKFKSQKMNDEAEKTTT